MQQLKTKYQLWQYNSDGGYNLTEFENLNDIPDLLTSLDTSDYYITQKLLIKVEEI